MECGVALDDVVKTGCRQSLVGAEYLQTLTVVAV